MRFFLTAFIALVLLLAVEDYRYWQRTVEQLHYSRQTLESALTQQLAQALEFPLRLEGLQLIPGEEADEIGLELKVHQANSKVQLHTVSLDLYAYRRGNTIVFKHPCIRPPSPQAAPLNNNPVYRSILQDQLRYERFTVQVPGTRPMSIHPPARLVSHFRLNKDGVSLKVGLALSHKHSKSLVTGDAWPACPHTD